MAFLPFLPAGDPDLATTRTILRDLAQQGVDLIELGFPYSDPIADGPVIQASYTRALERKIRVADIFETVASLRDDPSIPPILAMVSYSIVYRCGTESFVERAGEAGFAGFIVPDLPADESEPLARLAHEHRLDLVQLIAPTTPQDRATNVLKTSSGFIYCISVAGTTGVRQQLPPELTDQLNWLRSETTLPLCVGFGVSRPDQVAGLRGWADGI